MVVALWLNDGIPNIIEMAKPTHGALEPTMLAIMANIPMTPISIPKIRPPAIPPISPASARRPIVAEPARAPGILVVCACVADFRGTFSQG